MELEDFRMQVIKWTSVFLYPRLLPVKQRAKVEAAFRMKPPPPQPVGLMMRALASALHLQIQYIAADFGNQEATTVLLHSDLTAAATKFQQSTPDQVCEEC